MRRKDYGITVGNSADFVVLDATDAVDGLREIAPTLAGYKAGRRTYVRERARLLKPTGPN
jgi:cytosine deaminase